MRDIINASKIAEQNNLDFVQAHTPNYKFMGDNENHELGFLATIRSIEACSYLGIKNTVVHAGAHPSLKYPSGRDRYFEINKEYFLKLIPYLEKYDVTLLIENSCEQNRGDQYYFMTAGELNDFIAKVGHPKIRACWDFGHANMRGTNPYNDITTLGDNLRAVHVQDNFGNADHHLAPFMGTLDMDAVMQGLLNIDFKGYFTFETTDILTYAKSVLRPRREFPLPNPKRLASPSKELITYTVRLVYNIGKYILTQYDCFEE